VHRRDPEVAPRGRPNAHNGTVKRMWAFVVPGVILAVVGVIWTLQGVDVLRGSVMSGSSLWATVGPVVLVVGLVLVVIGILNARHHRTR